MTVPKPPPRTLNTDEERRVQRFLERAAPIVLDSPSLSAERWRMLAQIAAELEMSADEFRSTLDDLLHRGVLQRIDFQAPKPPPLPPRGSVASDSPAGDSLPEEGFALAPPREAIPPPLTFRLPPGASAATAPPPVPEAPPAAPPGLTGPSPEKPRTARWLSPTSGSTISPSGAAAAAGGGTAAPGGGLEVPGGGMAAPELSTPGGAVTEPSVRAASPPPADRVDEESGAGDRSSGRWRVEGEPPPIPPPPPKRPFQTFLDFVRQSCTALSGGVIPLEFEQRMLNHGVRLLGLSPVYARHLLLEVAGEKGLVMASGAALPGCSASQPPPSADPRDAAFAAAAVPLLAQHRGITPQSRLLLMAVAREQGLTEAEMESAIAALTAASAAPEVDPVREERLVPYREQVRLLLEKLPRGILAPHQFDKLILTGVESYGLERDTAQQAVREIAGQLKVAVVEMEQAEQFVSDQVSELLGDDGWLSAEKRERVMQTGAQWGLSPIRVEELIRRRVAARRGARVREEATTRLALGAAGVAVLFVVAFLIYAVVGSRSRRAPPPENAASSGALDRAPTLPAADPALDDRWWGVRLAFAVEQARQAFPELQPALRDIAARSATQRTAAYQRLVDQLLRPDRNDSERTLLLKVLSGCLAQDPQEDAISEPVTRLLQQVPFPGAKLPDSTDALSVVFWAVRTVTAALDEKPIADRRAAQLAERLGLAVGVVVDAAQPPAQIERACLAALGERMFRMLIDAIPGQVAQAAAIHAAVAQQTAPYLDARVRDKLNSEFLVAVLTASAGSWRQFESLVRTTSDSKEPLAVLKLLELYETTANAELQSFLGALLLARAGTTPESPSVEQVAEHVRRSLGVSGAADQDAAWRKLAREAQRAMAAANSGPDPLDPLLKELVQLTHFSTLACAMVNNAWGDVAIEALYKAGPRDPTSQPAPAAKPAMAPAVDEDPAQESAIRLAVARLNQRRLSPATQLETLAGLARVTDRVADLSPAHAAGLAAYLLNSRSGAEQKGVLEHAPALARWNQLLVALADRVDDSTLTDAQLRELLQGLLGREVKLPDASEGRRTARLELWRFVRHRLGSADAGAVSGGAGEATRLALFDLYVQQARTLNIPLKDADLVPKSPVPVLVALIREQASRLESAVADEAARAELARIAYELAAAEYVAVNELQLIAALERIWLRLLALEAGRRDASRLAEAKALVTELQEQDRRASHVLTQLRDGQSAILRLWLLAGRRN